MTKLFLAYLDFYYKHGSIVKNYKCDFLTDSYHIHEYEQSDKCIVAFCENGTLLTDDISWFIAQVGCFNFDIIAYFDGESFVKCDIETAKKYLVGETNNVA